jgi:hypothetical protein
MKELILALVVILIVTAVVLSGQTAIGAFADEEVLKGTIDGVNDTFTIARAPIPWISLKVFRNGVRLRRCRDGIAGPCDYTLVAPYNKLVFVPSQIPKVYVDGTTDLLLADYRY